MAAYSSTQAGNWNLASTWGGAGVPGDLDTATIAHAVSVTDSRTVGASGATLTTAITINAGGTLTVATTGSLRVRGDVLVASGTSSLVGVGAGSFIFDPPAGARYRVSCQPSGAGSVNFNGTSGARFQVSTDLARGGSKGYFTCAQTAFQGLKTATYADFTDLDDGSTAGASNTFASAAGSSVTYDHCKFTRCGKFQVNANGNATGAIAFTNNAFSSSTGTVTSSFNCCFDLRFNNARTTGTRTVTGNAFDLAVNLTSPQDCTITGNAFLGQIVGSATAWSSFQGNLVQGPASATSSFFTGYGDVVGNYFLNQAASNPHFVNTGTAFSQTISDNVFDSAVTTDGQGDCIVTQAPTTPITLSILRNLCLPDRAGTAAQQVGCLLTYAGNETAGRLSIAVEHNTGLLGTQFLISMGETANGTAGTFTSIRSNLGYNRVLGGATGGNNGLMGFNIGRSTTGTGAVTDLCAPGNIGYNLRFRARLTYTASGNAWFTNQANGWAAAFSATPGTTDVEFDPQFVDDTRNLATWDASKGGPGTYASGLARAVADPSLVASDLMPWVKAGFAPTNPAAHGAAHDGGDLGAVAAPPPTTYTLTAPAPASGAVGAASGNFTATLGPGALAATVTITPSAGSGGGTFAPATVTLTDVARSATFTYTPTSAGAKTIATTSGGALTDPAAVAYTAVAGGPTTYTLAGPAAIDIATPGTVAITLSAPAGTTVTITPSDGGAGGTFTPTACAIAPGGSSATFTYTPAVLGPLAVSATNDAGLADPAPLAVLGRAQAGSSGTTGTTRCPDLGGSFPTAGAWWQELARDVTDDPVHPQSPTLIGRYGAALLHLEMSTSTANGGSSVIGMPYNVVPGTQAQVPLAITSYHNPDQPATVPFHATMSIERWTDPTRPPAAADNFTGDHHAMVYERDESTGLPRRLHEYNYVESDDGGAHWHAVGGTTFDLATGAPGTDAYSSGDAAGLPVTPLLIRYDEVARGVIPHALRLAIPGGFSTAKWTWPARACSYSGAGGDAQVGLAGAASAGDATLAVVAMRSWPSGSGPLLYPGTKLTFAASGVTATVAADVAGLATAIAVDPLPGPIPAGDCATAAINTPFGCRYRLTRAWYDANRANFLPNVQRILDALRTHGGIVADLATPGIWLNGTNDARWTTAEIAQIKTIPAAAFEAVAVPARIAITPPASALAGSVATFSVSYALAGDSKFASSVYFYRSVDGGATWSSSGLSPIVSSFTDAARGPVAVTYTPATPGVHLFKADPYQDWLDPPVVGVLATAPATTYTLAGPAAGLEDAPSAPFSAALVPATTLASPVAITPSDGGAGGAFAPATVTLTDTARSATFTYTPATAAVATISVANDGGLVDPPPRPYTAIPPGGGPVGLDAAAMLAILAAGGTVQLPGGRAVRAAAEVPAAIDDLARADLPPTPADSGRLLAILAAGGTVLLPSGREIRSALEIPAALDELAR